MEKLLELFSDEAGGGFYMYAHDRDQLISRPKELYDGAAVNIQGSDDSAETTADSSEITAEETTEAAETAAK